jgi:hypothetical protein
MSRFGPASAIAVVVLALVPALALTAKAEPIGAPGSCPRPVDQYGARYESLTGVYQSRGETPGGGKFLTILPDRAVAPVSIMVTDGAFNAARTLRAGARITVVAYSSSSISGAQPPFSCLELAA